MAYFFQDLTPRIKVPVAENSERNFMTPTYIHKLNLGVNITYNMRNAVNTDVASDVGVNLCNDKSCLNTSNNEIFTDKRGDLPCVNISKHTCPVVK